MKGTGSQLAIGDERGRFVRVRSYAGVTVAILRKNYGEWHLLRYAQHIIGGILVLAAIALIGRHVPYEYAAPWFATSLVLLLAVRGPRSQFGSFMGGVSYSFYLNHWIGVFVAHAVLSPWGLREAPVAKIMALAVNVAVCSALHWAVDKKVLRMRGGWCTRGAGIALATWGLREAPVAKIMALAVNVAACSALHWAVDKKVLRMRGGWYTRGASIALATIGFTATLSGAAVGLALWVR